MSAEVLEPQHPRPSAAKIRAATAAIFDLLEDVEPTHDGQLQIGGSLAVAKLRKTGFTRAAVEWALLDLVRSGSLNPVVREMPVPQVFTLPFRSMPHVFDRGPTVPALSRQPSRTYYMTADGEKPFDHLMLMLTERGRRWWGDPKGLLDGHAASAQPDSKFTSEERQLLAARLIELREKIVERLHVRDGRLIQTIDEYFSDLEKQAAIQDRKAWLYMFVGVLATIILTLRPAQEAMNDLWRFAADAVTNFVDSVQSLPPP